MVVTQRRCIAIVFALLFMRSKTLNASGIDCGSDSDCGGWSYGSTLQCNQHSSCVSGRTIACTSTYYCGLSCGPGVCNNFFHVCDGDCHPMAGACDSGACGGEVCSDSGPCVGGGDGSGGSGGGGGGGGGGGCIPTTTCTGLLPACGTTGPGLNNCGVACVLNGPECFHQPPPGHVQLMISR